MVKRSGTDTILEGFVGISREKWLSKIRKDLRGKLVEEMDWKFDNDLRISPFVHAEDVGSHVSEIDFDAKWEI